MKPNQCWTEDQDSELRRLHALGFSMAEIAKAVNDKFGTVYSRRAVIGRARRINMPSRKPPIKTKPAPIIESIDLRMRLGIGAQVQAINRGPKIKVESFKPKTASVETLDIGLMDLTATTCRYPSGGENGAPITFCGLSCDVDHPYCAAHASIAYRPPQQRTHQRPHYRERRAA